jgi:ribosome-binding ATPase YchF (GTP1/OBG family)
MKVALFGTNGSGRKTLMTAMQGGKVVPPSPGKKTTVVVPVPDGRVLALSGIFNPKKTTYATVELSFEDQPGAELAKTLQTVRNNDVLVQVVGVFDKPGDPVELVRQELIRTASEMALCDLMVVDKRLSGLQKTGTKGVERDLFEKLHATLDAGQPLSTLAFSDVELEGLEVFSFLTLKKLITVVNLPESFPPADYAATEAKLRQGGANPLLLCASLEAEVATLSPEEQLGFLKELGMGEPASHRLVKGIFAALNLISFLTVGPDEVRAWPVASGSLAPRAAGKVHTDIERGFIRAEVVGYDDFIAAGSMAAAKRSGTFRTEGKSYVVKDGDIINFLFNV